MRKSVAAAMVAAPIAVGIITTPATGSAAPLDCGGGQWWDPTANMCRSLGEGPQPLNCAADQWWDPTANTCRPLGVGPQPLNCTDGWWWDPTINACAPNVAWPSL